MNFNYLRKIIKGETDKEGYLEKKIYTIEGAENHNGEKYSIIPSSVHKISYPQEISKYKYNDYITDFEVILKEKGHVFSEEIIHIITYIFLNLRDKSVTTERAWSKFISSMFTTCYLHLESPMMVEYDTEETLILLHYEVGRFDVGTFRDKIINETHSSYWADYYAGKEEYSSKPLSFRRIIDKTPIFDVIEFVHNKFSSIQEENLIYDIFFDAVTTKWYETFFSELEDEMLDSLIFGGADFASLVNPLVTSEGKSFIAIYSRIKGLRGEGWVTPLVHRMFGYSFETQRSVKEVNNQLKFYYKSMSHKSEDFHSLIITYRRLLGNGMRLLYQEKVDEAFMNMWIAMDTIFKKDSESNALKNRIAATTWYQWNTNHEMQYQTVNKLYSIRNKYVHSGIKVDRDNAIQMRDLSQTVLGVLLNFHNFQITQPRGYKEWIKDIDESYNLFYKKQPVNNEILKKIGVITE